jgi:hypothetical protein
VLEENQEGRGSLGVERERLERADPISERAAREDDVMTKMTIMAAISQFLLVLLAVIIACVLGVECT